MRVSSFRVLGPFAEGEAQGDQRALARPAVQLHGAVMDRRDLLTQSQTQPCAPGLAAAALIDHIERLAHLVQLLGRDAVAIVPH